MLDHGRGRYLRPPPALSETLIINLIDLEEYIIVGPKLSYNNPHTPTTKHDEGLILIFGISPEVEDKRKEGYSNACG
jgi:hypothetical protein